MANASKDRFSRRQFVAAGAAAATLPVSASAASGALQVDLEDPTDRLLAYLKMRCGVETGEYMFWFSGGLDMAAVGEPITPIITVESLVVRQVSKLPDNVFRITDFEAAIYRDPKTGELANELVNPINGRTVRPMHYREGPVEFEWRPDRQPKLLGMESPIDGKKEPFSYPYKRVGNNVYFTKATYFNNRQHWLDMEEWPLEAPAKTLNVASISTLKADWADLTNPELASVPTDLNYQATTGWLPWMEMGQTPGYVVWHEAGHKLASLDEAPADTVKLLRDIHPEFFRRPVPWEGFTNMFFQYKEQRKPAKP